MVFDSKLNLLRFHFNIQKPEDWREVLPSSVLSVDDVGEATLAHLRYLLAGQGITLRDDHTPEYWLSRLFQTRHGVLHKSDEDRSVLCPFTILVDSQEKHPFTFSGLTADAEDGTRPIVVSTQVKSLGVSRGDYSILGHEGECHIERKSIDDAIGTILGWGERRDRFVNTLEFLASCKTSAVVVEGTFGAVIVATKETKNKTQAENRKILQRQVLAWQQDYQVPWIFCDTRRFAERSAFQVMRRHYQKQIELMKLANRKAKKAKEQSR